MGFAGQSGGYAEPVKGRTYIGHAWGSLAHACYSICTDLGLYARCEKQKGICTNYPVTGS
jgi:hypothetical protein